MSPTICTAILLILSVAFLVLHEMMMQTWRPMFMLILISFGVALLIAHFGFKRAEIQSSSRRQVIKYSCLAVFLFVAIANILWAVSEEGLIHYYLATYGQDDTGGRYFYPGNSGMGYAQGLNSPFELITGIAFRSFLLAVILGLPLSVLIELKQNKANNAQ